MQPAVLPQPRRDFVGFFFPFFVVRHCSRAFHSSRPHLRARHQTLAFGIVRYAPVLYQVVCSNDTALKRNCIIRYRSIPTLVGSSLVGERGGRERGTVPLGRESGGPRHETAKRDARVTPHVSKVPRETWQGAHEAKTQLSTARDTPHPRSAHHARHAAYTLQ